MNIMITGVSKGLGLEIVKLVLSNGGTVYGISRSKSLELDILLEQYQNNLHWKSIDLSETIDIRNEIFKSWIGLDTPIHGFVNNAALAYDDIITDIDQLKTMYQINVFSPMHI